MLVLKLLFVFIKLLNLQDVVYFYYFKLFKYWLFTGLYFLKIYLPDCPLWNFRNFIELSNVTFVPFISLLLYEAYANESSQICPFLALRPEFHSNFRVILSAPRYFQSAIFGRLTFCVYTLLFYEFAFNVATPTARTPRPKRKPLCDKRGLRAEL